MSGCTTVPLQVMVSASRQEMVGVLLKDIVENSEKPTLGTETAEHDRFDATALTLFCGIVKIHRFGFRLESAAGSLVERAERLQRVAQENLQECELSMEETEARCRTVLVRNSRNCSGGRTAWWGWAGRATSP